MAILEFDRVNKVVRVLAPDTLVTLQEIYDKSQDWLDEPHQMNVPIFLEATGKQIFDQNSGDQTEIVLTMIDDWRIEFEARAGPATESMQITGGTLTAINSFSNNPISPTAFTQVQFRAAHSGVILNIESLRLLVAELHKIHGLDSTFALSITDSQRSVDTIVQDIADAGGTTTVTRQ